PPFHFCVPGRPHRPLRGCRAVFPAEILNGRVDRIKQQCYSSFHNRMSRWNKARLAAVVAYLLCACGLGFRSPGLHYDEAIYVNGAVQMLSPRQEVAFTADPWSWVRIFGRQWPVMI